MVLAPSSTFYDVVGIVGQISTMVHGNKGFYGSLIIPIGKEGGKLKACESYFYSN
jgi:hypothetical protein